MSAAPPKPPHELEALDYFVGIWSCTGRLEATADAPARKTQGSMIFRWELGKHFLGVAEDDDLSLEQPRRRQLRAYWGYDAGAKLYTCAVVLLRGRPLHRNVAGMARRRPDVLGRDVRGRRAARDAEGRSTRRATQTSPSASTSSGPTAIARAAWKKPAPARATTETSVSRWLGDGRFRSARRSCRAAAAPARAPCRSDRWRAKSSASKTWRISTSSPPSNGARLIHSTASALDLVCTASSRRPAPWSRRTGRR